MASDPTILYLKANAVENILTMVPKDCPSWRETSIQSAKLLRMLNDFMKKYEAHDAKFKGYNEEVRKLFSQQKVMQSHLNKLLEEYWVESNQGSRRSFRKDQLQKLNDMLDKKVYESLQRYKKQLTGLVGSDSKKLKS